MSENPTVSEEKHAKNRELVCGSHLELNSLKFRVSENPTLLMLNKMKREKYGE